MEHLDDVKYRDKLDAIGKIINNGDELLTEWKYRYTDYYNQSNKYRLPIP
jgi:hypothetical protein